MPRALGGAPVSRVLPVAPLGSGAPLAAAWAGCLPAFAMCVRRNCGLRRVGAAQATASSPDTLLQTKNKIF